jgi:hypothetical protein
MDANARPLHAVLRDLEANVCRRTYGTGDAFERA